MFGRGTLQNDKDIKKRLPGFRLSFFTQNLLVHCYDRHTYLGIKTPRDHEVILGGLAKHRLDQRISSKMIV